MKARKYAFLAGLGFTAMEPAEVGGTLAKLGYDGAEWTLAHFNPQAQRPAALAKVAEVTRAAGGSWLGDGFGFKEGLEVAAVANSRGRRAGPFCTIVNHR